MLGWLCQTCVCFISFELVNKIKNNHIVYTRTCKWGHWGVHDARVPYRQKFSREIFVKSLKTGFSRLIFHELGRSSQLKYRETTYS